MTDNRTYLGDGIYASFEHGMIWLRAEPTKGRHEIALEPSVYHALTEYAATIWAPGAQPALERIRAQAHTAVVPSARSAVPQRYVRLPSGSRRRRNAQAIPDRGDRAYATPATGPLFAEQKGRKPAHAMRAGPRRHPGLATKSEGFCTTRPHSCLMAAA